MTATAIVNSTQVDDEAELQKYIPTIMHKGLLPKKVLTHIRTMRYLEDQCVLLRSAQSQDSLTQQKDMCCFCFNLFLSLFSYL